MFKDLHIRPIILFCRQYFLQEVFVQFHFLVKITRGKDSINFTGSSFVWAISSFIHCLAELHFEAGVEQSFGCFIVQNLQAVKSMRTSMDWTLEDNMVDGLFFCATITGRGWGHLYRQEQKRTIQSAEAVKPALLGRVIPGGRVTGVWD